MKEERIKSNGKLVTVIITIMAVLSLAFSATYAIISANITTNNVAINANIGTRPIFVATPDKSIAMSVNITPSTASSVTLMTNGVANLNISLSNSYGNTTCTYDLIWQWDSSSSAYTITSGATKEYTVQGTNGTVSFSEKQVNNSSSGNTALYSGASIAVTNGNITTQTWKITASFYRTTQIQSGHLGKSYSGKVVATNVICG